MNPQVIRRSCVALWLWCGLAVLGGCSYWDGLIVRSQSPDGPESGASKARLVGDLAVPYNMAPVRVEAVGLVAGLRGTGSDPAPSPKRAVLLGEMQTRKVPNPNAVLASPSTSLVVLRGVLRPGIEKGDRFDIEVHVPPRSETTSLQGGFMLQTRLTELALLNHQIHEGHLLGFAEGPVLVDPSVTGKSNRVQLGRGRILGGGVALKSRPLGLVLKQNHQNCVNSARVATAVNRRFHIFENGAKIGVATAKTDKYIELAVHPRYKDNIARYVRVVRAVALRESVTQRRQRLADLRGRLLDPVTSAAAALKLEAAGRDGAETLLQGLKSNDPEVRFYSAEALAYLDRSEAVEELGQAARREPAFRVFALTALSAMDDFAAYGQLRDLLEVSSAETRYGAFRALWAMNPGDALVRGERMGGKFSYHLLNTADPPMIHVTRNLRPEIVLFGREQRFLTPIAVDAGNQVMVTSRGGDEITVSKFSVEEGDQQRVVSTRVDEVIRAIVELGGTYPDVVQALQEAKAAGALAGRFEVDALPQGGRTYDRHPGDEAGRRDIEDSTPQVSGPLPELFSKQGDRKPSDRGANGAKSWKPGPDSGRSPHPVKDFFAKIMGHDPD